MSAYAGVSTTVEKTMWIIAPQGFYSIVCKPGDGDTGMLTIRSRVRSDLECLKSYLPSLAKITEGEGTDYRFRAKAKRSDVAKAVAKMVEAIDYTNFKNEVAAKQGEKRAHVYADVWTALFALQSETSNSPQAFGGILIDTRGRILLRRPANDFDGYVWTFPKGRPEPWEDARQAALREVKEETGYSAEIVDQLPGSFEGGTTTTVYFLMHPQKESSSPDIAETAEVRWATLEEAPKLIKMTTNSKGRERDLAVLAALKSHPRLKFK
jgi:ADP-ribose pyrophosphatase YjhB (NUDIX family)